MLRRLGLNRKNLGVATLAIAFIFCVYLYYDLHNQLKLNEERNQRLKALQNSLSTQLQVVYEHKSRLERAIQDEKENHHKTKEERQELEMKLNREKQELQNRIQTVNQKQRILQAQFEDLQKELSKSEADYQLLKEDNKKEVEEYKEKIFLQSQQCDNDRKFLSDKISELKESQGDISQSLAQCQDLLRISKNNAHHVKNKSSDIWTSENKAGNVVEEGAGQKQRGNHEPQSHQSQKIKQIKPHINKDSFPTVHVFKEINENKHAFENKLSQKSTNEKSTTNAAFHRDEKLKDLRDSVINEIDKPNDKEGGDDVQPALPPVILAKPDTDVEKEDEQENEENENEGDDYQYDKNADDRDRADEFPENKDSNKVRNPVYPDDMDLANH